VPDPGLPDGLDEVLIAAQAAGFLGPGPLSVQRRHAAGYAPIARQAAQNAPGGLKGPILDLGSGGGLPGLVVALEWPEALLTLLDANQRRTGFLRDAVEGLGLTDRVRVVTARAEEAGRDPGLRGAFAGVIARSFGAPAVLAECAAPFLAQTGWLIVSEPPGDHLSTAPDVDRWPERPLSQLGLRVGAPVVEEFRYQVLHQFVACPERFPRRNGVPSKRPLF
jgi:16S rRNA (guanine527-N7)-methyltransferase